MTAGIVSPWAHQAQAASLAWSGRSVVIATGTASGKSLAYQLPALTAARTGRRLGGTTLYISPTKALAADQLRSLDEIGVPGVMATTYDGDTPIELRDVARTHATYLLTNPDMLHHAVLPTHHRWVGFLRSLRFVVVDECHGYRGVFGSHVAQVLRRLRRICAMYGSSPTFVLASATTANPARTAELLIGMLPIEAVTEDCSPSGAKTFLLWEPPLLGDGAPPIQVGPSSTAHVDDRPGAAPVPGARPDGSTVDATRTPGPRPDESTVDATRTPAGPRPDDASADASPAGGTPVAGAGPHVSPADDRPAGATPAYGGGPHVSPADDRPAGASVASGARPYVSPADDRPASAARAFAGPPVGTAGGAPAQVGGVDGGTARRRGVLAETADLLTDLVIADARTVAFVRSRRAAETVAGLARSALSEVDASLPDRVASYRAGYLAYERRSLEAALNDGSLVGLAATTALELGVDVSGLDAVLIAGWPGTRASLWQQAGRAGRAGQESLAVLVASDNPLDSYLVQHPEAIFEQPVEETVLDPDNPYVLAPHLCAAAAERPLTVEDGAIFGPATEDVLETLEHRRLLRRRVKAETTWHWTKRERPTDLADLRGSGGLVSLVEVDTGRVLGTVDGVRAHSTAHEGAVYVHQGETYLIESLDLDEGVAMARPGAPDYTTTAREVSTLRVLEESASEKWGQARLAFGTVEVVSQVVGYLKRALRSGEVLGEVPLDLPERRLRTRSVWWTLPDDAIAAAGVSIADAPGAAHAAEHASIGILPLVASCDRWDIGGLSTLLHPDTGMLTVFVHDGHPGGAGFAERGFHAARSWLTATRDTIAACPCRDGCPSCVQSPKCGNGNEPLDKAGAVRLLDMLLSGTD
ncbi:DEAD/DEAH box helicase [Jiangella anatolica]|uniref:DEAD/DEAH box helicase n=2 Tax=Jiangella anatolica TaxID=2670374 RepID=A0A2W2BUP9_9ACTN|nr:DEAD/DEAH box helicase [Jiangella anatolica]